MPTRAKPAAKAATRARPSHTAAKTADGRELAQHEMVLLSFARAAGWSTKKVPYEELVLQAWRDYPHAFSLRNHPDHPDASDIHKRLYANLKAEGQIVSLGNKIFRLTDKGVGAAQALQAALDGVAAPGTGERLGREEQMFLSQAARSRVFQAWKAGAGDDLIDYDAGVFFGFTTGTPPAERKRRVELAMGALAKARDLGEENASELHALGAFLAERFADLLKDKGG